MQYGKKYNLILEEWRKFVSGVPIVCNEILSPIILDSWKRSQSYGIDPFTTPVAPALNEVKTEEILRANSEFIYISLPYMKNLHEIVKGSGFLIILFDSEAHVLNIISDSDSVLKKVTDRNTVGTCWSEEFIGTNGVGIVAKTGKPVQLCGTEHYIITHHKWTCSTAPIYDPSNNMVGIIDMTGPYDKSNPHSLGMVTAAAYAIENEIRLRDTYKELQISHNFQKTIISSIPELIIAIENDGIIRLINENARKLFQADGEIVGKNIKEIIRDRKLANAIINTDYITDIETAISHDNSLSDFFLSCHPIMTTGDGKEGKVIILNEIKRAKSMVTRMIGAKAKFNFKDIIGKNEKFLETIRLAKIASQSNSNVLLLGESGTGKDIFTQAIHNASSRSNGPYVAINCSTIPRDLIASDLFGYSDGAFTGSRKGGSQGKFELADGGTIFLDEIAETPLEMQAALLRVIEEKTIMRVGGTKFKSIDVRIIAATNRKLKEQVRGGKFREDLFYRFNVITIHLVPLRERKDDIPLLIDSFVRKIGQNIGKIIEKIENDVMEKLIDYTWPGNVRELQNVLERMINIAHLNTLTANLLPSEIIETYSVNKEFYFESNEIEREFIEKMILSNVPKKQIAKRMGIARSTLYRKLEELKISESAPKKT